MNNIGKDVKDVLIMNIARLRTAEFEHKRLKEIAFSFKLRKPFNEEFTGTIKDNWVIANTAQALMPDDPNLKDKPINGKWLINHPTSDSTEQFP